MHYFKLNQDLLLLEHEEVNKRWLCVVLYL